MRLIGIQALLGLLQQRISAEAEAHGTGSGILATVAISNAGVVGHASGIGSATSGGITSGRISGVGHAASVGVATSVGVKGGLFVGVGSATSQGSSAAIGEIRGLTAGIAQSSGYGIASATPSSLAVAAGAGSGAAQGVTIGVNASAASASGAGASSVAGEGNLAVSATASAAGTGAAAAVKGADPVGDFLARTSGLDSTHTTAYSNLINGLVSDAVWDKLDVLYVFATQDSATALLNLVSSNYNGTANGSPSFTTDRGYTGVDSSLTVYIDSGFNPTTASSPKFTTNSCHVSAWADNAVTSSGSGGCVIGSTLGVSPTTQYTGIYPRYVDGNAYFRINDNAASAGGASASSVGHWLANRTGSSASAGYKNGASFLTINTAAGSLRNRTISVLGLDGGISGSTSSGSACQVTMASIGGGLTGTDITNFYNRLRTYMTAVGVP